MKRLAKAEENIVNKSDDQHAIGHIFMVGLPGIELDDSTRALICDLKIHNFILFRRNVDNKEQLKRLCSALINACLVNDLPKPLISIDQEGGQVARLPPPFAQFDAPRQIACGPQAEQKLEEFARTCAQELLEIDVNMNLAPVLDVCPVGKGLFMEQRCLGEDPATVAELGTLVINQMQDVGVAACAKHFPGLGSASLDPHMELPVVDQPLSTFEKIDFLPFQRAIAAGVAAIMTSHAVYSQIDSGLPGTLSSQVVHDLLRKNGQAFDESETALFKKLSN